MKNNKFWTFQILRFVASALVVLHHIDGSTRYYTKECFMNDSFKAGWSGVDLFFVLSGFIIMYSNFNKINSFSLIELKKYLRNRFVRIYPSYWLISTCALLPLLYSKNLNLRYIISSYLLIEKNPFLGVSWSLVYEVMFYLIFSISLFLRLRLFLAFLVVWLIVIISFSNSMLLLNNYNIEFILGVFTAVVVKKVAIPRKLTRLFSVLSILLILYIYFLLNESSLNLKFSLQTRILLGLASSILILGLAKTERNESSLIIRIFVLIGDASFAVYLIHPLLLAFFYKYFSFLILTNLISANLFGILVLLFTILTGVIYHLVIEIRLLEKLRTR